MLQVKPKTRETTSKDKEKVEEFKSIPTKSENIIRETTTKNNALEKEKEKEEEN